MNQSTDSNWHVTSSSILSIISERAITGENLQQMLQFAADLIVDHHFSNSVLIKYEDTSNNTEPCLITCNLNATEIEKILAEIEFMQEAQQLNPDKGLQLIFNSGEEINTLLASSPGTNGYRFSLFLARSNTDDPFENRDEYFISTLFNIFMLSVKRSIEQLDLANLKNIINAKKELEYSVDNLREVLCLIDENGGIIRANKAIENYGDGDIRLVKGKTVHDVLHRGCRDKKCMLDTAWRDLIEKSLHSGLEICEIYDGALDSDIRLTLKRNNDPRSNEQHMLLIIEDISDLKVEEKMLETYTEELYTLVQNQSLQIGKVSAALDYEVHKNARNEVSLQQSKNRLKSLSAKLLTAHEEERKRIASDLHDGIGQSISAIKFSLENLISTHAHIDDALRKRNNLLALVERLQETTEEVRNICMGLRPSMLDDLGLIPTLHWFCRKYQETFHNITLSVNIDIEEEHVHDTRKLVIFRIIQEALNNVTKHAAADMVSVHLSIRENSLLLSVEDNGIGFTADNQQIIKGFGLGSMRERASLSDGLLEIDSRIGKGTTVRAEWPLTNSESSAN